MIVAVALQARACRAEEDGSARLGRLPLPRAARLLLILAALGLAAFPYVAAVVGERGDGARTPAFGETSRRLGSVGTNRYAYWRVAMDTARAEPLRGAGAGSFRVEWLRERPFAENARDAHSLYLETLAELGIVGLLALLALLGGIALGAGRVFAADPGLATGPIAGLAVWAVHAGVDWDWEMPGVTLVAITLAGLVLAQAETLRR
jgi:O-antigen ligase